MNRDSMEARKVILHHCQEAHTITEQCYRGHPAAKGEPRWLEKRGYLLADLSLHMVQAALQGDEPDPANIRRYLFSILTICQDFIPETDLVATANELVEPEKT